jgi:RHS repeat-associated protein
VNTIRQKFTGAERDSESTLDFMQARYYSGVMGRFLGPDPGNAGAMLGDPQSWNGYGYVSGNPLTFTDPSGMISATGTGAEAGGSICGPVCAGIGAGIGAAIDLGLALWGIFGFGGGQADLSSVASTPVTLQPSPSADLQGSGEQVPGSGDSGGLYEPGSLWNERAPITGWGGPFNTGGIFGRGSAGPFILSNAYTGNVGIAGSQTLPFGISWTVFFGIVFDFHGHVALYSGGGAGRGIGVGRSVGVQGSVSNADTVCGFGGPFGNVSGTVGGGTAATVDVYTGKDDRGRVIAGTGVTLGIGGGASASTYGTLTHIKPLGKFSCGK